MDVQYFEFVVQNKSWKVALEKYYASHEMPLSWLSMWSLIEYQLIDLITKLNNN